MDAVSARGLLGSERGSNVIEMAIVLPLLLLLIMGILDFGFLFQRYVVLTNAAVEGARVATLPGTRMRTRSLVCRATPTTAEFPTR